ncbi:MAG: cytochrome b/b6 domain-containing protein [Alphaproteobacteria bacterium]
MPEPIENTVRVWDPLVRIGHWTLVGTFAVAFFLGDEILTLHVWAGYLLGAVVVIRIAWGFVGPRHARFTDFVYKPRTVLSYLADMLTFRARRYLGHSPAGGAMIVVLLSMLAATVFSGLMAYAVEKNRGPLAPYVAQISVQLVAPARADDGEERDEVWEDLHEAISNITFFLVLLHIGGVAVASFAHRENLVRAMITGDKRSELEK